MNKKLKFKKKIKNCTVDNFILNSLVPQYSIKLLPRGLLNREVLFTRVDETVVLPRIIVYQRFYFEEAMKPVKILKRPTANTNSPTPTNPADRVSAEIKSLLEAFLNRERSRLESIYRARHDALLRTVSDVLNNSLERVVASAAKREMDSMMTAFVNLASSNPENSMFPVVDEQFSHEIREAFISTFEKSLLPQFEQSIARLLKSVAETVESQIDERLVVPSTEVATSIERASDSLRSARAEISDIRATDPDGSALARVQTAIDEGDIVQALRLSMNQSAEVQGKAVNSVLNSDARPEDTFRDSVFSVPELIKFASLLMNELSDRTELRLQWLYEIITSMGDEGSLADREEVEIDEFRFLLKDMISRLHEFQTSGSPSPQETKDARLLTRVLQTHLRVISP